MINIPLVESYFILFLIYSFCGWSIETIGELIKSKKFVNRGFLVGPICPVYGVGACLITAILTRYSDDLFAIFGLSAILCGLLEYFTSFIMEKLFNARWWDYSNYKYNINGRICLEFIGLFAIAGILIIRFINPIIYIYFIDMIPFEVLNIICIVFGLILFVDIIFSFNVMNKIKDISTQVSKDVKDNTEEISTKVRKILLEKSAPYRRILEAFPQAFADKVKERKEQLINTANMVKDKTIENINNAVTKTKENITFVKRKTIHSFAKLKYNYKKLKKKREKNEK